MNRIKAIIAFQSNGSPQRIIHSNHMRSRVVFLLFILLFQSGTASPVAIQVGDRYNFSTRFASYLSINSTEYTDVDFEFVTEVTVLELGYLNRTITVQERSVLGNETKLSKLDSWQFYMFFMIMGNWQYRDAVEHPELVNFTKPPEETDSDGEGPENNRTTGYFISSDETQYEKFFIYDNWFVEESGLQGTMDRENNVLYFRNNGTKHESGVFEDVAWQVSLDFSYEIILDYGRSILSKVYSSWTLVVQYGDAIRVEGFTFKLEEYNGLLGIYGGTVGKFLSTGLGVLATVLITIYFLFKKLRRRNS